MKSIRLKISSAENASPDPNPPPRGTPRRKRREDPVAGEGRVGGVAAPSVKIRPCEERDVAAVTEIYAHHVRHSLATFELEPPDHAEIRRRWRALLGGGYVYLVAERDANIVGYAYAGPYRARPAYRFTVEDSIYVAPEAQRHGIGRALLDRLLAEAQVRGFRQMIAVIGDSAQTSSIALHQACGFCLVGTFEAVGFKFDRWLDSVLMQKALGTGATTAP